MAVQEHLDRWKREAEELRLQSHLGKLEAEEAFEARKKELNRWLNDRKGDLKHFSNLSEAKITEIRGEIDDLALQLSLGKAEGKVALLEQQEKITKKIQGLKEELKSLGKNSKEQVGNWSQEASDTLERYEMKFDLFRLQFHLGLKDGLDILEQKKQDFSEGITHFKAKIQEIEHKGEAKWDTFKNEISEAWAHFKKAF